MKRTLSVLALAACAVTATATAGAQAHAYAGAKACGMCHNTPAQGGQRGIWEKSKHATAFATLATPAANDIAKKKGLAKPAAESPECLQCHAIVGDVKAEAKDGVQCESCHGAGADYKAMTVMKDKAASIKAGMREFKDKAAIEAQCKTCHNEKSPTAKEFKFEERCAKIQHPKPKQ
jgi:ubiquitin